MDMRDTLELFESRKSEVLFYCQILDKFDKDMPLDLTPDNSRLFKIMKSNFLLMLYNLVESCVISGMMAIYAGVRANNCHYLNVIDEIKSIWTKNEMNKVYSPTTGLDAYIDKTTNMIMRVVENQPLELTRECLGGAIGGNLDARRIKQLCDAHRIRYIAKDRDEVLLKVKNKRNDLSHGDVSFSDCARDMTIEDLKGIMRGTFDFLQGILSGMEKYYNEKGYLANSETVS
jgi:hypothetical protein